MKVENKQNGFDVIHEFNNGCNIDSYLYADNIDKRLTVGDDDFYYILLYLVLESKNIDDMLIGKVEEMECLKNKIFEYIVVCYEDEQPVDNDIETIFKSYKEVPESSNELFESRYMNYDRRFEKYCSYLKHSNLEFFIYFIENEFEGKYDECGDVRTFSYPKKLYGLLSNGVKTNIKIKATDLIDDLNIKIKDIKNLWNI